VMGDRENEGCEPDFRIIVSVANHHPITTSAASNHREQSEQSPRV
jgi:hypothetical protein